MAGRGRRRLARAPSPPTRYSRRLDAGGPTRRAPSRLVRLAYQPPAEQQAASATGPRGRRRRPRSLHVATPRSRLVHTPPSRGTVGVPAAPPRAETRRRRRRRTRATRAEHGVQCARLQENICPRKHYSTFISVNVGPTKPGPQPQSSFPVSRGHAVVVLRRPASTAQTPAPLEPARPSSPSPSPSSFSLPFAALCWCRSADPRLDGTWGPPSPIDSRR
jgi:hypothetical protein